MLQLCLKCSINSLDLSKEGVNMPESTMLRYRIDKDLKEEAEAVFRSMVGLSPQSAIKLFYRQTVIMKKLPFHLSPPGYN